MHYINEKYSVTLFSQILASNINSNYLNILPLLLCVELHSIGQFVFHFPSTCIDHFSLIVFLHFLPRLPLYSLTFRPGASFLIPIVLLEMMHWGAPAPSSWLAGKKPRNSESVARTGLAWLETDFTIQRHGGGCKDVQGSGY